VTFYEECKATTSGGRTTMRDHSARNARPELLQ